MPRAIRITGFVVGGFVLLLVAAALSLLLLVKPNSFKPMLESNLTRMLGRQVSVGDLKLSILSGGVSASDLAIADDPAFSRAPFLQAKSLKLGVELWPLIFSRKLNVTGLTIEEPSVALLQNAAGDWNVSTLGARKAPGAPEAAAPAESEKGGLAVTAKLVRISGGRFSLATGGRGKPLSLNDVNLEVRDFSALSAFPFTFSAKVAGGGEAKVEGKAGPIDPGDAMLTPVSAKLDVTGLDLAGSGLTAGSPVAGLVSFAGDGNSVGGTVGLDARIRVERFRMARNGTPARRPLQFDFRATHDLKKHAGVLERGAIRVGSAPASLTGSYSQREGSTLVNMKFSGPRMPVPELAELLPPMGITLPAGSSLQGGYAAANFTIQGPVDRLVTSGAVRLDDTTLAGFDLGSKVALIQQLAGIKGSPDTRIQTFSSDFRVAPEGISAQGIRLLAPGIGELTGGGAISPSNALDFKMRAAVLAAANAGRIGAVLSQAPVPFLIQGSASNPVFRPDMKALQAQGVQELKSRAGKTATGILDQLLRGRKK